MNMILNKSNYVSAAVIAHYASFEDGADVVSFSFSRNSTATPLERLLVQDVLDNGTVIVRSAGNNNYKNSDNDRFPFAYQVDNRIIIVSSTDINDCHTHPSPLPSDTTHANFPQVSICAPGYYIVGAIRYNNGTVAYPYGRGEGTSHATPMVAGVCALMKSINKSLTPTEVKNIIQTTADPIADAHLYPGTVGAGRVNAYKAVQAACATTVNFTNQTVTSNTTVTSPCSDINVQNVTVTNNAKLTLDAPGEVTITSDFEVQLGSELEIK